MEVVYMLAWGLGCSWEWFRNVCDFTNEVDGCKMYNYLSTASPLFNNTQIKEPR